MKNQFIKLDVLAWKKPIPATAPFFDSRSAIFNINSIHCITYEKDLDVYSLDCGNSHYYISTESYITLVAIIK